MTTITLARNAMATRFEVVLNGENALALRAAGEEALEEIERLEAQLSLFRPTSEIAHLNARAAREPVRVTPAVFDLLEHAQRLSRETAGAFDITIAPLVRCWGFMGGGGSRPSVEEIERAREKVGSRLIELNPEDLTVRFAREGVMLDLGAIGKGYAIERSVEILQEAGITSGLIHGGTSTVYALGSPPDGEFWRVAIEDPLGTTRGHGPVGQAFEPAGSGCFPGARSAPALEDLPMHREEAGKPARHPPHVEAAGRASSAPACVFRTVHLKDAALSVSAVWGKFFEEEGSTYGHVIDPRTGYSVRAAVLAAVALSSATETDALSTALLTLGLEGQALISGLRPGIRTLVAAEKDGKVEVRDQGIPAA